MESRFTTQVFAFCPACGSRNGRAVTEKLFSCPDCDFRFYANPAAAVGGFLTNEDGDVLWVRRGKEPSKGKLNIPGGFVDPYESAEEALRREIREEVGFEVSEMIFLASFPNLYRYRGVLYHTVDMFFQCRIANAPEFQPNEEISEICYRPPETILFEELAFESTKSALRFLLERIGDKTA
jgi:ADP-ribose pyrophosphatase YjhB (NUDIX family)